MRSGTTSWYRYLGDHPDISMMPKELQFFTEHYEKGLGWYRDCCRAAATGGLVGEATADYFARESAMARIADVLPDIKIIASLRNPVERAWSHYGLLAARGHEQRPFARALADELEAIQTHGPSAEGVFYLYHGLYDIHLERAFRLFDRSQIHVSIFERMVSDPTTSYRAACDFLGAPSSHLPDQLGEPVNPYVTFRSLGVRRMARRMPGLPGRLVARLNTRRPARAPDLEPRLLLKLQDFYDPRIDTIRNLLDDALPEW